MDKTRILQRGEEAKFRVKIKDFSMDDGDFSLKLIYGYRRTTVEIEKSQMFKGSDGEWYFIFDTDDMTGRVTAVCSWRVPDSDCDDGYREEVDEQYLCFVAQTPCPQFVSCPNCDISDLRVTYVRTEQSDIADEYAYLLTSEGDKLISSDNEVLLVLKETE